MTLLPSEDWQVQVVQELPPYKVGPHCCVPGCISFADHAHHLWRRSFLGITPCNYVKIGGVVVGNLVGLCTRHHEDVTGKVGGHKAWIRWEPEQKMFIWCAVSNDWESGTATPVPVGPLTQQPPQHVSLEPVAALPIPEPERCQACGQVKRRPTKPSEPSAMRQRGSWTIKVPEDEREKGADVLDELCEQVLEALGRHHHTSSIARYWAVVESFVFLLQHASLIERNAS